VVALEAKFLNSFLDRTFRFKRDPRAVVEHTIDCRKADSSGAG
jgi:hypothetical protein